jgi:hypothetical protein
MRYFVLFLLTMLYLGIQPAQLSFADGDPPKGPTGPTAPTTPSGGGGSCDLSAYKNSLFQTESKGAGGYTATNSLCANGMYQFMDYTAPELNAYQNAPADCKGLCVSGSGLNREACAGVQEAMMDEFTMKNLNTLQTSSNCAAARDAVGSKTVQGYRYNDYQKVPCEPCTVSWSGLLAGAHLGGATGICNTLRTGNDVDDAGSAKRWGTSRLCYVCKHRDLPVPETDCNPQSYPTPEGSYQPLPGSYTPWKGTAPPAGLNLFDSTEALKDLWNGTLGLFAEQLSVMMMQQVQIIGHFLDAKHQLESQRLIQEKTAEAHKRYHPSEQMCAIGTFVRSLTDSERRAMLTQVALQNSIIDRALKTNDVSTFNNSSDELTRRDLYLQKFCVDEDNYAQNTDICRRAATPDMENADVNFFQTVYGPLTLDLDMQDPAVVNQETTIFAFLDNIFMHNAFPWLNIPTTNLSAFVQPYMDMRSLLAIRSVAQNSMAYIISEKTHSTDNMEQSSAPFMKAMMVEMGIAPDQVNAMIGENPSYYAQMEVLTKMIYYHPDFVANLYDKPANVKRIAAALTAIKSMQNWKIHQALQRREMLFSMLLEVKLREKQNELETIDIPIMLYGQPDVAP